MKDFLVRQVKSGTSGPLAWCEGVTSSAGETHSVTAIGLINLVRTAFSLMDTYGVWRTVMG